MRDQTGVRLNDLQVSFVMVYNTESLSEIEIKDVKQSKYAIIYGHSGICWKSKELSRFSET